MNKFLHVLQGSWLLGVFLLVSFSVIGIARVMDANTDSGSGIDLASETTTLAEAGSGVITPNSLDGAGTGNIGSQQVIDLPRTDLYSLDLRWSLITWAGAGIGDAVIIKNTGTSGMNSGDNSILAGVTAIYGWDASTKNGFNYFPSGDIVPGANEAMSLSSQAYWSANLMDTGAFRLGAVIVDSETRITESLGGQTAEISTADIPALSVLPHEIIGVTTNDAVAVPRTGFQITDNVGVNETGGWKNYQLDPVNLTLNVSPGHFALVTFMIAGLAAVALMASPDSPSTSSKRRMSKRFGAPIVAGGFTSG